ncbi:MAG: hypothetical protein LUG57_06690, partial [Oscillospiraceae bacterium]|nr:hypothetical protein [Oscillospiraceae bacterium]
PTATPTAAPTDTVAPTETPADTANPSPTASAEPTAVPTATAAASSPDTGDGASPALWLAVLALCAGCLAVMAMRKRRS